MKILIIEDEPLAVAKLKGFLLRYNPSYEILGDVDSIEEAVEWLQQHSEPDLLFVDIQLADGLSFEIFKQVSINVPLVFVTAYDQYAIQAFKQNSVDYILKPYDYDAIVTALKKFEVNHQKVVKNTIDLNQLEEAMRALSKRYKQRFVVKMGERLLSIETANIQAFLSEDKYTMLIDEKGTKYIIQYPLDQLLLILDPIKFFRINRKFILHISAIKEMVAYSGSRLKVELKAFEHEDLIVSREKVAVFKEWLG